MKAVVIDRFGGVDELKVRELPDPIPGPGEIRIRVAYSGVNPVDYKIREGHLVGHLPHDFPLIPGWEAAGTVDAVGSDVGGFEFGQAVFAYCRKPVVKMGTYAELVTVRAEAVAPVPEGLSLPVAASVPLVALTAWQSLFGFAGLKAGESVLVNGASGGVGGYAVQFAKLVGAKVYATCGRGNLGYVKELGADVPIDYTTADFGSAVLQREPAGVDFVMDCVGGETLKQSYALAKVGGRLVSIVDTPEASRAAERNLKAGYVFVSPNGEELASIGALLAARKIVPLPIEELPIAQVAEAHRRSETRHVRGKLVLKVGGGF